MLLSPFHPVVPLPPPKLPCTIPQRIELGRVMKRVMVAIWASTCRRTSWSGVVVVVVEKKRRRRGRQVNAPGPPGGMAPRQRREQRRMAVRRVVCTSNVVRGGGCEKG